MGVAASIRRLDYVLRADISRSSYMVERESHRGSLQHKQFRIREI